MTSGSHQPWLVVLLCLASACDSPVGYSLQDQIVPATPFVVSNAVTFGGPVPGAMRASTSVDPVSFVSILPGTLTAGNAVSVRVRRTGAEAFGIVVNGGMDPVAVPAVGGDTLGLTVTGPEGPVASYVFGVPARRPPTIIRTYPGPGKRDVPLNLRVEVVLSEPIDPASMALPNLEVRSGNGAIAGQLRFSNPAHTVVEFIPAVPLSPATNYELVLRPGIQDLDGTPLEAGVRIPFTTAATAEPVSQLAFVRDGQIQLVNSDGTGLLQLTHTGIDVQNLDPAWSPDGRRLAFSRNQDDEWDIYIMNADGSNVVRRTGGGYNVEPAWSPDGRRIAFTSQRNGNVGVWSIEADGEPDLTAVLDRAGVASNPAWSPDGRTVTFTSDWRAFDFLYDLYRVNADGSDVRPLLEGPFFSADGQTFYFQSVWSRDGRKIAVVVCEYALDNCFPHSAIALLNPDGTGLEVIALSGGYSRPTWSPDGRTIMYSTAPCRECEPALRFVRADGSAEGPFLPNGHSPAWRPR